MATFWRNAGRADGRTPLRRRRPEYDTVQVPCRQAAALRGYRAWHFSQPRNTMQSAGLPDDLLTGGPRLIAVEYKAGRKRQTPDQAAFQAAWEASGGVYILCRSAAELVAALDALQEG